MQPHLFEYFLSGLIERGSSLLDKILEGGHSYRRRRLP
jgi:hypothetical protein